MIGTSVESGGHIIAASWFLVAKREPEIKEVEVDDLTRLTRNESSTQVLDLSSGSLFASSELHFGNLSKESLKSPFLELDVDATFPMWLWHSSWT